MMSKLSDLGQLQSLCILTICFTFLTLKAGVSSVPNCLGTKNEFFKKETHQSSMLKML